MGRILLVWVIFFVAVATGEEPRARHVDSRSQAKHEYELGDKAFRLGDFQAAAQHFRAAYDLFPTPLLLFNLAQSYRQLGDHKQAVFFYKQFVAADTSGSEHDAALKRIKELEEILEKERLAQEAPPAGPSQPATLETTPPAPSAPPKADKLPVHKKWWLWTAIGGAVVVGVALGLGVGLTRDHGSNFDATLGTVGPKALVQW